MTGPADPTGRRVVLVGDPGERTLLAGARQLAADAWDVILVSTAGRQMVGRSRAVGCVHQVVGPERDGEQFVAGVAAAVRSHPGAVVMVGGDAELIALSAAADRLPLSAGLPTSAAVRALLDKRELAAAADRCGLATPQLAPPRPQAWPVFVKSVVHYAPGRQATRWEVRRADSPEQLAAALADAARDGVEVLVQQHAGGQRVSLILVLDVDGSVVVRVQQHVQGWSVGGGPALRAVTIPVEEDLAQAGAALLRSVGWVGLAELEFMIERGRPVLFDVNPRLYGSVGLAAAAGAPVAALAAQVLRGDRPARHADGRPGVRFTYLLAGLRAAADGATPWRDGTAMLLGPLRRPHVGPIWSHSDPVPGLWQLASVAREVLRSAVHRRS